jgi:hypothetical protein
MSAPALVKRRIAQLAAVALIAGGTSLVGGLAAQATDASVPDAPQNVAVDQSNGTVDITWDAPDNGGSAITGYTVDVYDAAAFDGNDGSGDDATGSSTPGSSSPGADATSTDDPTDNTTAATPIVSDTVTTTTDSVDPQTAGLVLGSSYVVLVTATNAVGDSDPSDQADFSYVTAPTAPSGVAVLLHDGELQVSWTPSASAGQEALTGYRAYAYLTTDYQASPTTAQPVQWCSSEHEGDLRTACRIEHLPLDADYTLVVTAVNDAGESAPSEPAAYTMPATPSAPLGVSAQMKGKKLKVSWKSPKDNGGDSITGYTATVYKGSSSKVAGSCLAGAGQHSCTTKNLKGSNFTVAVTASNDAGDSRQSKRQHGH